MAKFVTYLRSGARPLLDPVQQRAAAAAYMAEVGGIAVAEMIEVEVGRQPDRSQLGLALQECRAHGARLAIVCLGRLPADRNFVSTLIASGTEFVALDAPEASRHTLGILAAFAETRAAAASDRSRVALAAARKRGVRLGNPKGVGRTLTGQDRAKASAAKVERARQRAGLLRHVLADLRAEGAVTLRDIAAGLNKRDIPATRGGEWRASQVARVLAFLD